MLLQVLGGRLSCKTWGDLQDLNLMHHLLHTEHIPQSQLLFVSPFLLPYAPALVTPHPDVQILHEGSHLSKGVP